MAGEQFLLTGDQLATFTSSTVTFPPPNGDSHIQLNGLSTLGTEADRFFLVRTSGDGDTITNGQFFTIYAAVSDGNGGLEPAATPLFAANFATPDAYDNTGAGDNYIIFGLFSGTRFVVNLDGFNGATEATFIEGQDNTGDDGELQLSEIEANVICFTEGTRIRTPDADVLIQDLTAGDLVSTVDGRAKRISWIGSRTIRFKGDGSDDKLRPVRISAGALGHQLPASDLSVSRQHRMLVSSKIAMRMFDAPEILVAAIRLTELPGIFVDRDRKEVTYYHFLLEKHEIVFANGAPSESLFTGAETLKTVSPKARREILEIFPELAHEGHDAAKAGIVPSSKLQKKFISRHLKNRKPLLETYTPH